MLMGLCKDWRAADMWVVGLIFMEMLNFNNLRHFANIKH